MTKRVGAPGIAVLLVVLAGSVCGRAEPTAFGAMIEGPERETTRALEQLSSHPGLSWVRARSPIPGRYGLRWLSDVRYFARGTGTLSHRLPEDLFEVFWACRTNSFASGNGPDAWEVWNEPDFFWIENNASDMAAVLKAAWWGIRGNRPEVPVLMPSLAFCPSRYSLELARNGLASWTDGMNFHFYGRAADFQSNIAQQKLFARWSGIEPRFWLTEVGYYELPATAALDEAALARQAAFHERVAIESWMSGVDHHLAFILTPFIEAGMDLSLTNPNGQPRPALQSLFTLSRRLPGHKPLAWILHLPSKERIGAVLESSEGDCWTILWTPDRQRELKTPDATALPRSPASLKLQMRWSRGVESVQLGIDSATTLHSSQLSTVELTPEHNVFLRTASGRVLLEDCRWVPISRTDESAPRISRKARREIGDLPPRRSPSPTVVRLKMDEAWISEKPAQSYRWRPEEAARLTLQLHNFSDAAQKGRVQFEVPEGWSFEARSGFSNALEGSELLTVPALGRLDVPLQASVSASAPNHPGRLTVRWQGEDSSEDEASIRLQPERPTPPVWRAYQWRDFRPRSDWPEGWQIFEIGPDVFSVEIKAPGPMRPDALVLLPVPRGTRDSDSFSCRLRMSQGRTKVWAQVFLLTDDGEAWRYSEWQVIPQEGLSLMARLEDFAPTIWSRHTTFLFPPVERARWIAIRFQGVQAGDVIEVDTPAIRREGRRPNRS